MSRRPTRVLFITWRDLVHQQAGGSELVADRLLAGLHDRGYEVALLSGTPLARHDYTTVASGGTYTQYLLAPLVYWRRFRGWDVVVDVDNGIPFFSPLWRRGPVICLVHHVHTDQWPLYFPKAVARFGSWLESTCMPHVYRDAEFIAVSDSTKRALIPLGIDPERIFTVAEGVDPVDERVQAPRSETPLFMCLGRLVPHKRVELVLDVWEKVRPVTGGELVIVGSGPERHRLERIAGPDVRFTGYLSDAERHELLDRAWFLVHTTMHEGWGLTVMEGAVRGTPSIALDVVGLRDSILDDATGVLVQSTDELVTAWIELAFDPPRRDRYSDAARRWAAEHTWDRAVDTVAARIDAQTRPLPPMSNDNMPSTDSLVSIVIPAFNEGHRLPDVLPKVVQAARDHRLEIIFVDDGSTDDTAALAESAFDSVEFARVIRLPRNTGKGAAVRTGVLAAQGSKIVYMDADLATTLESLPGMLLALETADVAVGSRAAPGAVVRDVSLKRIVMGRCYNRLARVLTDLRLRDTQCGFKGYRAEAARQLYQLSTVDGFGFDVEVLALASRLRLRIVEVPVDWTAIEGTRVRPLVDAVKMTRDLIHTAREVKRLQLPEPATQRSDQTEPDAEALPA